ncbi:hypothetical protein SLS62_006993 [Diatrype stigma]|uniref:NADP-dependent oxidoreductase domain-containing protein n=1 Tax=Diatrype stigma TaxID=117547 RepID=A0AAN9YMG8_9PEZI
MAIPYFNPRSLISVDLSRQFQLETFEVGPHRFPRLLNGLWQLASPSWGSGSAKDQNIALAQLVEQGFVAADMADHYGDAELVYGGFRNSLAPEIREQVYAATKWCIFSPVEEPITTEWVLKQVKERCLRLGGRVELLQFHWYDYEAKEYLDILVELVRITLSHPELVSTIGLCNFDSQHTREACEYVLGKTGTVGIVSNQFSLLDARPRQKMCDVCNKYGLKLLAYGSFQVRPEDILRGKWAYTVTAKGELLPLIVSRNQCLTRPTWQYFDMMNTWGSWEEFQVLLEVLSSIAQKYGVSLTNIATRWVLQQPAVGAVIVGTRLGVSAHGKENARVFDFELDDVDMKAINAVALGEDFGKANAVYAQLGDCGNEYRAMH